MKRTLDGVVFCCECRPFRLFYPPAAAAQAQAHYEAGRHDTKTYAAAIEVRA